MGIFNYVLTFFHIKITASEAGRKLLLFPKLHFLQKVDAIYDMISNSLQKPFPGTWRVINDWKQSAQNYQRKIVFVQPDCCLRWKTVDKGRAVEIIYLDFSKAFDVLFHSVLIAEEVWTRWMDARLVGKTLDCWAWRLVLNGLKYSWWPVMSVFFDSIVG